MFTVAVILLCLAADLPGLVEAGYCTYGVPPRPDPKKCDIFYECENGQWFRKKCPSGLAYNPIKQECDWPGETSTCNASAFLNFECPPYPTDPSGQGRYPIKGDCRSYIICVNGQPRKLGCQKGTVFNPKTGICVNPVYGSGC